MAYNSRLFNFYVAGLYETFCFVNPGTCYLFDFTFMKDKQGMKLYDLIMENL